MNFNSVSCSFNDYTFTQLVRSLSKKSYLARGVKFTASLGSQASPRTLLLLSVFLCGIAGPSRVAAYDVCSDDYAGKGIKSCAHENMFDEAMRFYEGLAEETRFSQEISEYKETIREGVGDPDEADPLYDNTGVGGVITTITHFWDPDNSFGQPQVQGLDPYPNAFNISQALWTRALGEYAAGRKTKAYTYLGMIAHFLGDQTVPAHANGDTHPEKINDGDAFEEWMSNPLLNKTLLTDDEYDGLVAKGLIEIPDYETADQLLWLFLNINQVADYFASDDYEGDSNLPNDPRYPYADNYARDALNAAIAACDGVCPTTSDQLQDNDKNTYPYYYDIDDDLDLIRTISYVPGVRRLAALFTLWEEAIQNPIMTLTVHQMKETGFTDAVVCLGATLGLDDCDRPDLYLGVVMGDRRQSSVPPGTLLESDNAAHSYRKLDGGRAYPANVTRTDANNSIAEDKVTVNADYHFGQSFKPNSNTGEFVPGVDFINLVMQVRDQDVTNVLSSPYGEDDIALIHPQGFNEINLRVDLAKCSSSDPAGLGILYFNLFSDPRFYYKEYACASSTADSSKTILVGGGRGGDGDFGEDSDDVDVKFSVSMFVADTEPPIITCTTADGAWHAEDVSITCNAVDDGSGLENAADASFLLLTNVPVGTETDNALTNTREVCDAVGNCATAGPIGGNKIDKKAPTITIVEPTAREYTHSETLMLDYTVADDGSGVRSIIPTINGSATVAGNSLLSGQSIDLLTSLSLGDYNFTVNADDNVSNASPPESVNFTIIVTPQSIIDAVNQLRARGDIDKKIVQSLLAKLRNAQRKWQQDQCTPAQNIYGAFINHLQAQSDKSVNSLAVGILIADAQYLIAHCEDSDLINNVNNSVTASEEDISPQGDDLSPDNLTSNLTKGNTSVSGGGSIDGWASILILFMMLYRRRRVIG